MPLYTCRGGLQAVVYRSGGLFEPPEPHGGAEALDAQGRCVSRDFGLLAFVEPLYTGCLQRGYW